jgi:hypothetical protein
MMVVAVTAVRRRGDNGSSDFAGEDKDRLVPVFDEPRDDDTTVRPELDPDEPDMGRGVV